MQDGRLLLKPIPTVLVFDTIFGDKSIKRTVNPRLFLLTDRMDVSGRIVDVRYNPDDATSVESTLVKDGHGEYTYPGFDESDYFLHEFEIEHQYTLKGLHQKRIKMMSTIRKSVS